MNESTQSQETQTPPPEIPLGLRLNPPGSKSVALAGILSAFVGLGHVYLGYYRRGFIHFAIFAGTIYVLSQPGVGGDLGPLLGPFLGFFWCYNLLDAIRKAGAYNRALRGGAYGEEIELPSDDGFGNAAGVLLTAAGVMLLMHTRFDYDFYWLEEWWPVGLILLGASILRKNFRASGKSEPERPAGG